MNTKKSGKLFILSAPSGGGKTTLANKLVEELGFEYNLSRVITYTSRLPRSTETPGVDYNFLSKEAFEEKVKEQFFLEWSGVYGNYCGTPSTIIEEVKNGKSYIAVVDRAGARSILSRYQKAVAIWLEPPSLEVLEERLRARKTEAEEQIQKRLTLARQELEEEACVSFYKYRLCNDVLEQVQDEAIAIFLAELLKKQDCPE